MRFNPDATVWVAKQRILCTLNHTLKDVLNYGLFQPPGDGQDGRFLDEERVLREYPQPVIKGVPSLEVSGAPIFKPQAALHSSLTACPLTVPLQEQSLPGARRGRKADRQTSHQGEFVEGEASSEQICAANDAFPKMS